MIDEAAPKTMAPAAATAMLSHGRNHGTPWSTSTLVNSRRAIPIPHSDPTTTAVIGSLYPFYEHHDLQLPESHADGPHGAELSHSQNQVGGNGVRDADNTDERHHSHQAEEQDSELHEEIAFLPVFGLMVIQASAHACLGEGTQAVECVQHGHGECLVVFNKQYQCHSAVSPRSWSALSSLVSARRIRIDVLPVSAGTPD